MRAARTLLATSLVTAAILFAGTAPSYALTPDEIFNYKGADRQKMLEEGAKKEGEFSWYSTLEVEVGSRPVNEAFQKKYPFLKSEFIRSTSAATMQRATAEFRAKSVRVDVVAAGAVDGLSGLGLLQKFWSPYLAEYNPDYLDKGGEWVGFRTGWVGIAWNTNLVKPGEAPKSWEDLINIDPKFKGKIAWPNTAVSGGPRLITHWRAMWGDDKTVEFLKKLATLDIRTSLGSTNEVIDQTILGEYAFSFASAMHVVGRLKADGAPIDGANYDPALTKTSGLAPLNGAPHPHAAMLFMDWMLSTEGQQALADAKYNPSHPKVKPAPELVWTVPGLNGQKELVLDPVKEAQMTPKSVEMFKAYFRGE